LKPPIQLRVYSRCEIPRAPGPDGIAAVQATPFATALLSGVLAATEEATKEFVLGVRILGKSIRDTGMQRDMVVLVSDGVSEYLRELLEVCSASSATAKVATGVRLLRRVCDSQARRRSPPPSPCLGPPSSRRRPPCSEGAGAVERGLYLLLFSI
jgi:hypothetical protein